MFHILRLRPLDLFILSLQLKQITSQSIIMKRALLEILYTALLAIVLFFVLNSMVQNFRINGTSMMPNLENGQYVLVNKAAYWFGHEPERGDIIVLHAPETDEKLDRIKLIIGLPGDTVHVNDDGTVIINGIPVDEPYITPKTGGTTGTWTVPEGKYFVLGDNRSVSYDSRSWLFLPREDIIGKAWFIIWDLNDIGRVPNYDLELESSV